MTNLTMQLVVTEHTCSCGHRWTHSHQVLSTRDGRMYGGTPLPAERISLPTTSIRIGASVPHTSCYRCVDPSLRVSYTTTLTLNPRRTEEELLP
jgi:hypothetical protein